MAYEEISGNGGNNENREFVSAKIGATFEGVFQGMSRRLPSQFGGEFRVVSLDLVDGRKVALSAGKILLERLEDADLEQGDRVKIVVESAQSKQGRKYALPRVYVDRSGSQVATSRPAADDEPPF
ncbi:hypothetical protein [Saccharopolyspora pogona]|uniref:hypothetical protein n=1 Tax=Saccharopolyspora pogona TaxID=333966 RepID=UPI001685DC4A|nr:hypothetical protein [Saccharopolyspora pogona]